GIEDLLLDDLVDGELVLDPIEELLAGLDGPFGRRFELVEEGLHLAVVFLQQCDRVHGSFPCRLVALVCPTRVRAGRLLEPCGPTQRRDDSVTAHDIASARPRRRPATSAARADPTTAVR